MLPSPELIKKCSRCAGLSKQRTVASGNTAGATFWTDGSFFVPMLPQTPPLVSWPHCNEIGWQADFGEVDRCPDRSQLFFLMQDALDNGMPRDAIRMKQNLREQYKDLPYLEDALPQAVARFIKTRKLSFKREAGARTLLWQRWNDVQRDDPARHPLNRDELDNLERLRLLLTSKEDA